MRRFAQEYRDLEFVQQLAAQLTWFHIVLLLDKVKDRKHQIFYMKKIVEYCWSRSVLTMQIELELHKRQGQAITNFQSKLASPQSDLAHYTFKYPYVFDFLSIWNTAHEREV
ncbi:DUF1016 N-terminal domain-containing protein [Rickettsia akari]|uniref:DUF1016 N-terminal domain-containing protein n=1 Tax=Rickettsia akari TaxID=786 RepID=UPI000046221A|nr:DUF1016 N-terminal domain-containing protein [Rickettsia akari]